VPQIGNAPCARQSLCEAFQEKRLSEALLVAMSDGTPFASPPATQRMEQP